MGANYDLIIAPASPSNALTTCISGFLATRGLQTTAIVELGSVEINDDNAILLSRPSNGWVQILADHFRVGVDLSDWFHCNPLAIALSARLRHCIHLWSLDSGYVAGYSIYEDGTNTDRKCAFSILASRTDELMDGIPIPETRDSVESLGRLLRSTYSFADSVSHSPNLESAVGSLVARFGFDAHLLEFCEAIDDRQGVAISGAVYDVVELDGWAALRFEPEGTT